MHYVHISYPLMVLLVSDTALEVMQVHYCAYLDVSEHVEKNWIIAAPSMDD